MKTLIFALLSGMIFSSATLASPLSNDIWSSFAKPTQISTTQKPDDVQIMGVCCPVSGPACGWGDFPIGSECYCKHGNKVYPGTVCGK
ncbi:hypothetical protein [Bdellovibrio sp. HCB288]|uniref:hypothetical protein n=1 Tax=Bdellovibrio sp. HCB288 TaxID=3394355 RepID=UPI0039B4C5FA